MLLAIDIGNTHTVLGLYEGDRLAHDFRVQTDAHRTADEMLVLLLSLIRVPGVSPSAITASIVGSVVPSLNETVVEAIERGFGHQALVVGPGIKTGMPILYENPREVGADRIVNAVAAYERVRGAVIVVDFGTATTFDCISDKGQYVGGAIAPGIRISADALFSRAAKLPHTAIARPPRAIGRNTIDSMRSGIVFGYVGLVDGLVDRLRAELGTPCAVLATGGLAVLIATESRTIEDVDDYLTLEGLRLLYARNA